MHNPTRPLVSAGSTSDSDMFAFCTACNNISASEKDVCFWCGSSQIEMLSLSEISTRLRHSILSQRDTSVASAIPEARFRLSF